MGTSRAQIEEVTLDGGSRSLLWGSEEEWRVQLQLHLKGWAPVAFSSLGGLTIPAYAGQQFP